MTEIVALANQERECRARLDHALRASSVSVVATSLLHDLSQPLTAIDVWVKMSLRLLQKGTEPGSEIAENLDQIAKIVQRTKDMLTDFRGKLSHSEPTIRRIDLNELLRNAARDLVLDTENGGMVIHYEAAPDLPIVHADPELVKLVISILCRNSLDAIEDRHDAVASILIRPRVGAGATVEIWISDNGPGIDDALVGRLFEPIVSTKRDGLGLGLAICRMLLQTLGGRIRLEANSRNGVTFVFSLPVASQGESVG